MSPTRRFATHAGAAERLLIQVNPRCAERSAIALIKSFAACDAELP
jgi:hypothetical protein